uniref:Uncharacterized protein n=1 Tax=Glossina austeni TaxID=7395 RepID=A0A1A9UQW7_GLOAU
MTNVRIMREDPIKRISKRSGDERYTDVSDRKRTSGSATRFEAPPPPRFDASLASSRSSHSYDKKRDEYSSSSSSKRLDDYSSSKRLDFGGSSGTKRAAIDDFSSVPSKRSSDDYSKRSNDYIAPSSSKRGGIDDYGSNTKSTRDDYKRDVEIRHMPSSSSGSLHKSSGSGSSRYESERSSYRRIDDISSTKRYDSSSGYGGSAGGSVWPPSSSSHMGHSSGGGGSSSLKSYPSNSLSSTIHSAGSGWTKSGPVEESNWRPMPSSQDRYDRTYNERSSGGYPNAGSSGSLYSGNRTGPDRYGGGVSSRY